ncbi:MAG: type II secretion system F family protein [Burkholderiales bacterium]|nr:type II secretion system F family protein [Burkholderiales bacterium]
MDYWYFGFLILGFLAVAGFLEGLFLAWNAYRGPEAKRIERRLRAMSAGIESQETPLVKKRLLSEVPFMQSLLLRMPRVQLLDRMLVQSGSSMTVADLLTVCVLDVAGAMVLWALVELPAVVGIALIVVGLFGPFVYILRMRNRRLIKMDEQLPDALDLMARAMLAGHSFSSALNMVALEGPEPISQEFRTTFDEINFGVSLQDALINLATRVASTDLRYFVVAVLVQRETGGNLADLLTNIGNLIRDRQKLTRAVRVLSAEGRLSAWVLGLLPFFVGTAIGSVNPEFLSVLWKDELGRTLTEGAAILMVIGVVWMWRIIKIRI